MPANKRSSAPPPSDSPNNTKATARYTNKDGSKMITVPKGTPAAEPSEPPTPTSMTQSAASSQPIPTPGSPANGAAPPVNRKKAKRRAKAAAKAAAAAAASATDGPTAETAGKGGINGQSRPASGNAPASTPASEKNQPAPDSELTEDDEHHAQGQHQDQAGQANTNGNGSGTATATSGKAKKHKKKKKKNHDGTPSQDGAQFASPSTSTSRSQASAQPRGSGISKEKIWNTSSQEERERIKEFWLGLGEEDRKSLVKVEKDAVLRKMKEQQKHTCSCTVCGRKRIAIEEELEGLYDAYYEELEQFANQADGPPLPRDFPVRPSRLPSAYVRQRPSRGRIVEHVGDDEDDEDYEEDEDEYSEEELDEDDEYSVDEPPEDVHPHDRDMADFLTFGNSLQVKGMKILDLLLRSYGNMDLGGILTVADDLLKNDGKRFIEMMEQLAERRMAREEDAKEHLSRAYGQSASSSAAAAAAAAAAAGPAPSAASATSSNAPPPPPPHAPNGGVPAAYPPTLGQPAPDDEYEDEDDEEEEYEDSQDDEYEDEEDTMTEEQRMEEGRRMFQIFAARMFEQRVLTAYRNMVAQQRQNKLLEEIDEERRLDEQRKAKKAKDAQKRKDRAALKKQAQAEERARKEAERAAEEAAQLEEQRRRAEEQRQKAEEKRRKKEEQKRLEEAERQRKEAERQKRLQEQEKKRAEQERKAREAKEQERKQKEEARQREREAREQKEKQQREKREKQEREKREREAKAKAAAAEREREAKSKAKAAAAAEREARERQRQEEKAATAAAAAAAAAEKVAAAQKATIPSAAPGSNAPAPLTSSSQHAVPVPNVPTAVLPQHPSNPAAYASPKVQVATPALPKAPTPMRPRNATTPQSQHETSAGGLHASQSSQHASPHSTTATQHSPAPVPFALHPQAQQQQQQQPFPQQQPQHQQQLPRRKGSGILPPGLTPAAQTPSSASPPINGRSSAGIPSGPYGVPPGIPHPPGFNMPPPGLHHRFPQDTMFSPPGSFRPPGMMTGPPGLSPSGGRAFPISQAPPGFSQAFNDPIAVSGPSPATHHTRQASGSGGFDAGLAGPAQPISRPSPIGRPGSVVHGQSTEQADDTSNQHLGSSALLDDSEEAAAAAAAAARQRHHVAPGLRQGFPSAPFGMDAGLHMPNNLWANPAPFAPFGAPPGLGHLSNLGTIGNPTWGNNGLGQLPSMGPMAQLRTAGNPRSVAVRLLLCQACQELQGRSGDDKDGNETSGGMTDLEAVVAKMDQLNRIEMVSRETITEGEILNLAETEGTPQNGGGTFEVLLDSKGPGKHTIRWVPDAGTDGPQPRRAVGEIGSPVTGFSHPAAAAAAATVPSRGP